MKYQDKKIVIKDLFGFFILALNVVIGTSFIAVAQSNYGIFISGIVAFVGIMTYAVLNIQACMANGHKPESTFALYLCTFVLSVILAYETYEYESWIGAVILAGVIVAEYTIVFVICHNKARKVKKKRKK